MGMNVLRAIAVGVGVAAIVLCIVDTPEAAPRVVRVAIGSLVPEGTPWADSFKE